MTFLRRLTSVAAVALVCALLTLPSQAQERSDMLPRVSPNASVGQTVGVTEVTVTYGRPSVNDRTIYGDLVPYGEVWRTGANEATAISFSTPVMIEGESLDAGTYGLFTIPGEEEWTIIFNDTAQQWGAYNYDDSEDVLRVTVEPREIDMTEMMTFTFQEVTDTTATLHLHWAETGVPVSIATDTHANIRQMANAAAESPDNWQAPARYAQYAYRNDTMLEDALSWIEASVNQQKTFANTSMHARILAKMGRYDEAVTVGNDAVSMAESMDETPDGLEEFRGMMSEWKQQ